MDIRSSLVGKVPCHQMYVLNAFQCLGGSLTVDVYNEMEQYVLQLYSSGRPSEISNLA